jgi:DNA-binding GntR family transcriptional regulator
MQLFGAKAESCIQSGDSRRHFPLFDDCRARQAMPMWVDFRLEPTVTELVLHHADHWQRTQSNARPHEADSLHDEVLVRLRDAIVEGRLGPGARVPERELCAEIGVSRTPLREALKVLAAEGLIELLPNRGARVRRFTEKDVRECFEVLAAVESAAGRLACARITDGEIAAIERLHYEMYACYLRRELPAYFRLNQAIHASIVDAAGNGTLKATHQSFTARMRQFRYSANSLGRNRWGEAMREHEGMLDALHRRATEELASILFGHLIRKYEAASQNLEGSAASPTPAIAGG